MPGQRRPSPGTAVHKRWFLLVVVVHALLYIISFWNFPAGLNASPYRSEVAIFNLATMACHLRNESEPVTHDKKVTASTQTVDALPGATPSRGIQPVSTTSSVPILVSGTRYPAAGVLSLTEGADCNDDKVMAWRQYAHLFMDFTR
jgi:hypothetical protein